MSLKASVAYTTGENEDEDSMTDFRSGMFVIGDINAAYGINDWAAITIDFHSWTSDILRSDIGGNRYPLGNPQIGADFRVLHNEAASIDLFAKYGFGLTRNKDDDSRYPISRNTLQVGTRIYGQQNAFSWAIKGSALHSLKFDEHDDPDKDTYKSRTDLIVSVEAMYRLNEAWAIKAQYDYQYFAKQKRTGDYPRNFPGFSDHYVLLGAVTKFKSLDLMPFIKYHFENTIDGHKEANDMFQIGLQMGATF